MSWSLGGRPFRLAVPVALAVAVGVALLLPLRRRVEVWHTLPDRDTGTGP